MYNIHGKSCTQRASTEETTQHMYMYNIHGKSCTQRASTEETTHHNTCTCIIYMENHVLSELAQRKQHITTHVHV